MAALGAGDAGGKSGVESQAEGTLIRAGSCTRGRAGADRGRSENLDHWERAKLRVRQLGTCQGCPWARGAVQGRKRRGPAAGATDCRRTEEDRGRREGALKALGRSGVATLRVRTAGRESYQRRSIGDWTRKISQAESEKEFLGLQCGLGVRARCRDLYLVCVPEIGEGGLLEKVELAMAWE